MGGGKEPRRFLGYRGTQAGLVEPVPAPDREDQYPNFERAPPRAWMSLVDNRQLFYYCQALRITFPYNSVTHILQVKIGPDEWAPAAYRDGVCVGADSAVSWLMSVPLDESRQALQDRGLVTHWLKVEQGPKPPRLKKTMKRGSF